MRELEGRCWMAGSLGGSKSPGQLAHPPLCRTARRRKDLITSSLHLAAICSRETFPGTGTGLAAECPGDPAHVTTRRVFKPNRPLPTLCQNRGEAELEIVHSWLFVECPTEVL